MNIKREIGEALGDAAREGIERLAKSVDDWGWRGGKPGEITGGEFLRIYDKALTYGKTPEYENAVKKFKKQLEDAWRKNPRSLGGKEETIDVHQSRIIGSLGSKNADQESEYAWVKGIRNIAQDFSFLENAGIPREWTGKVVTAVPPRQWSTLPAFSEFYAPAVRGSGMVMADATRKLSSLMRPMTNDQRETFLSLIPRWTGTLDQAASAAKKLYRRPS